MSHCDSQSVKINDATFPDWLAKMKSSAKIVPPYGYQQVYVGQTFALTNGEVWTVSSIRGSCSMVLLSNASGVK